MIDDDASSNVTSSELLYLKKTLENLQTLELNHCTISPKEFYVDASVASSSSVHHHRHHRSHTHETTDASLALVSRIEANCCKALAGPTVRFEWQARAAAVTPCAAAAELRDGVGSIFCLFHSL